MPGPDSASVESPVTAEEASGAEKADPGQKTTYKGKKRDRGKTKPGKSDVPKGKGGGGGGGGGGDKPEKPEKEKTWAEFQLLDAAGKPVKGEKVKIKRGSKEAEEDGTTNSKGIVRVNDLEEGESVSCRLVERFNYEWKYVRTEDVAKPAEKGGDEKAPAPAKKDEAESGVGAKG